MYILEVCWDIRLDNKTEEELDCLAGLIEVIIELQEEGFLK